MYSLIPRTSANNYILMQILFSILLLLFLSSLHVIKS